MKNYANSAHNKTYVKIMEEGLKKHDNTFGFEKGKNYLQGNLNAMFASEVNITKLQDVEEIVEKVRPSSGSRLEMSRNEARNGCKTQPITPGNLFE